VNGTINTLTPIAELKHFSLSLFLLVVEDRTIKPPMAVRQLRHKHENNNHHERSVKGRVCCGTSWSGSSSSARTFRKSAEENHLRNEGSPSSVTWTLTNEGRTTRSTERMQMQLASDYQVIVLVPCR
jgi:hypothetical protein